MLIKPVFQPNRLIMSTAFSNLSCAVINLFTDCKTLPQFCLMMMICNEQRQEWKMQMLGLTSGELDTVLFVIWSIVIVNVLCYLVNGQ